MLYGRVTGL